MTQRSTFPRPAARVGSARASRAWLVALLALLCAVPAATAPTMRGGIPEADDVGGGPALAARRRPSPGGRYPSNDDPLAEAVALPPVHYRHAEAHAGDVIAFEPGDARQRPVPAPRPTTTGRSTGGAERPAGGPRDRRSRCARRRPRHSGRPDAGGPRSSGPGTGAPSTCPRVLGRRRPRFGEARCGRCGASGRRPSSARAGSGARSSGSCPYWQLTDSVDRPRLADAVDRRLLQRRLHELRRPLEAQRRRLGLDRLGRLDELEDDLGHQRAHEHGTRVVLTLTCFAWSNAGASTQASVLGSPDRAGDARPPGRRGGPRPRRGRRQPRLRADRPWLRRRVHGARAGSAARAQRDRARLPAHVRRDGRPSATSRSPRRPRRAARTR